METKKRELQDPKTFEECFCEKNVWLSKKMVVDKPFVCELMDKNLLTKNQMETIMAEKTNQNRAIELMRTLERGDDEKIDVFLKALRSTNQQHVIKRILGRQIDEHEFRPSSQSSQSDCDSPGDRGASSSLKDARKTNDERKVEHHIPCAQVATKRKLFHNKDNRQHETLSDENVTLANHASTNKENRSTSVKPASAVDDSVSQPKVARTVSNSATLSEGKLYNICGEHGGYTLKDMRRFLGISNTPAITVKVTRVDPSMSTPTKRRSPVNSYFKMWLQDENDTSYGMKALIFDKPQLLRWFMNVEGQTIEIPAGGYGVREDKHDPNAIYLAVNVQGKLIENQQL